MSDLPKRLYVGAQNDILYLVDEPPSPAGNDYPLATAGSDPIAKFFASDRRTQQLAQALVDAYNAEIDVADKRAQAHLLAAGWLPPDEAERLKADFDQLAVALTVSIDNARAAGEDIDKAEAQLEFLESQLAVLLPVIKLLWPEGGAKRVPFDRVSQLPEAVEWLLQQRVLLTELLDKAERERDQAIAHDRQPYPTAEAYERACAAWRYHRDIADRATALLVQEQASTGLFAGEVLEYGRSLRAEFEAGAPGPERRLVDALAAARLAAVQPVIDAARKMIAKRDQKYGPNRGDPAWWSGHDFEWDLVKAIDALDAADGQPEGPTT